MKKGSGEMDFKDKGANFLDGKYMLELRVHVKLLGDLGYHPWLLEQLLDLLRSIPDRQIFRVRPSSRGPRSSRSRFTP